MHRIFGICNQNLVLKRPNMLSKENGSYKLKLRKFNLILRRQKGENND